MSRIELDDAQLAIFDADVLFACTERTDEHDLLGVLADVDEPACTGQA